MSEKLENLKAFFQIPDNQKEIFQSFMDKGGPIINELLLKISDWKNTPLIFLQYSTFIPFENKFKARFLLLDNQFVPIDNVEIKIGLNDITISEALITKNIYAIDLDISNIPEEQENDKTYLLRNLILTFKFKDNVKIVPLSLYSQEKGTYGIFIFCDRHLFKPDQTLHASIIAWQYVNGTFAINQSEYVFLSIINAENRKIYFKKEKLNNFGSLNMKIKLADDLEEGIYSFQVKIGNSSKSETFELSYFKKPDIDIILKDYSKFIFKEDQKIFLNFQAIYMWNELVKDANCRINLLTEKSEPITSISTIINEFGEQKSEIPIPPNISGKIIVIEIEVEDKFLRSAKKSITIPIISTLVNFTPLGSLNCYASINNSLTIKLTDFENIPIPSQKVLCSITFNNYVLYALDTTTNNGFVTFLFDLHEIKEITTPSQAKLEIETNYNGKLIRFIADIVVFPKQEDLQKRLNVLELSIKDSKNNYNLGDIITLIVKNKAKNPIYLIFKRDIIIDFFEIRIFEENFEYNIPLKGHYWGDLVIEGFTFTNDVYLASASTHISVSPVNKKLDLSININKKEFHPKESIDLNVLIQKKNNVELNAEMTIAMVDKAILSLVDKSKDPVKELFRPQFDNMEYITYFSWNRDLFQNNIIELLELLHYLVYLDKNEMLKLIFLIKRVSEIGLISKDSLDLFIKKLIEVIIRHSKFQTPLWLYFFGKNSTEVNLTYTIQELFNFVQKNWLKEGNLFEKVNKIEEELTDLVNKEELSQKDFNEIYLLVFSDILEEVPNLIVINKILKYIELHKDTITTNIIESIEKKINSLFVDKELKSTLTESEYNSVPVIISFGSKYIKMGYEGLNSPDLTIMNVIGYPKYQGIMSDVDHHVREFYTDDSISNRTKTRYSPLAETGKETDLKNELLVKEIEQPPENVFDKFTIRRWFPDTAYFIHSLQYQENKPIQMKLELPDKIGSQILYALAYTRNCEIGLASKELIIRQELFIEPNLPDKLIYGEIIDFSIHLTNNFDTDLEARCSINSNALELITDEYDLKNLKVQLKKKSVYIFNVKCIPKLLGTQILNLTAETDLFSDIVEYPIEILPSGFPETKEYSFETFPNSSLEIAIEKDIKSIKREISLSFADSGLYTIFQGLLNLLQFNHFCNEQIASTLLTMSYIYQYFNNDLEMLAIYKEKFENYASISIQKLMKNYKKDFGWSWFSYTDKEIDPQTLFLSLHIFEALIEAKQLGYEIEKDILEEVAVCILNNIQIFISNKNVKLGSRIYSKLFLASKSFLVLSKVMNKEKLIKILKYIDENQNLISDPFEQALVAFVYLQLQRDITKKIHFLIEKGVKSEKFIYWKSINGIENQFTVTASIIHLLAITKMYPEIVTKGKNWLMAQWNTEYSFGSTHNTVAGIKTLLALKPVFSNFNISLSLNNNLIGNYEINETNLEEITILLSHLKIPQINSDAKLNISIKKENPTKDENQLMIISLIDKKWFPNETSFLKESNILVPYKIYNKVLVEKNEKITCQITLQIREKIPLVVIEDVLPTGFILDTNSLAQKEYKVELQQKLIKIYIQEAYGEQRIEYTIIPTLKGEFIASGIKSYSMYNPEIAAWSAPIILTVK